MSGQAYPDGGTRVEVVDEWHHAWPRVLAFIERAGRRNELYVNPAGWVSARQAVLAAFVGDEVVGHLAFHIEPLVDALRDGNDAPLLRAKLDSCLVAEGMDGAAIGGSLRDAAIDWARRIHCDPEPMGHIQVA